MEKTRKELRDELYILRLQLELTKKEGKGNEEKIKVINSKISDVRSKIAKAILEEQKGVKDGKSI